MNHHNSQNQSLRALVDKVLGVILIIIMTVLVLDVLLQVASRYILRAPSSFTDELAGFLLIWVGMFGAAYGTGKGLHLAIDLLPSRLTGSGRTYLLIFINFLVALFAITVFVAGGIWLVYTRFYLGQISAALQIPLGVVYLVMPLSGMFILYYSFDNALSAYRSRQPVK